MSSVKISSTVLKIGVVVISITGVLVLSLLSYIARDREVELADLGSALGENIVTRGLLVGKDSAQGGAIMLLLSDGNATAEVLIEKGGTNLEAGSRLKLKGEVRSYGSGLLIEVVSDRSIEVLKKGPSTTLASAWSENGFGHFTGTVETSYWTGPGTFEAVLKGNSSDADRGPLRVSVTCWRVDALPGAGDIVIAIGLMQEGGSMLCYGDGSMNVLMKAVPVSSELISLVETLSHDPWMAPVGPFTLKGYIRSEPGLSRYAIIGESPDGGRINIRVRLPDGALALHRGDLVELTNSTLYWDTDQARYGLRPEAVCIVKPYGPWRLDLGSAGDQLRYYIGSPVSLTGTLCLTDWCWVIKDEGAELLVTNVTGEMDDGASGILTGILEFDATTTRLYMDAGKGDWKV